MNRFVASNVFDLQFKSTQSIQSIQSNFRSYNNYNSQNVQRQFFDQRFNSTQKRVYYDEKNQSTSKNFADIYHAQKNHDDYISFDYYQHENIGDFSHEQNQSKKFVNNENELKTFFVVSSKMIFTCRRCSEKFSFNNKLHYHIRRCKITKSIAIFAVFRIIDVFHNQFISFKIVHSTALTKTHFDHDFRF